MEIASYRILVATARRLGDEDAVRTLSGILQQEQAMADWLAAHMDQLTNDFLTRSARDETAKR